MIHLEDRDIVLTIENSQITIEGFQHALRDLIKNVNPHKLRGDSLYHLMAVLDGLCIAKKKGTDIIVPLESIDEHLPEICRALIDLMRGYNSYGSDISESDTFKAVWELQEAFTLSVWQAKEALKIDARKERERDERFIRSAKA